MGGNMVDVKDGRSLKFVNQPQQNPSKKCGTGGDLNDNKIKGQQGHINRGSSVSSLANLPPSFKNFRSKCKRQTDPSRVPSEGAMGYSERRAAFLAWKIDMYMDGHKDEQAEFAATARDTPQCARQHGCGRSYNAVFSAYNKALGASAPRTQKCVNAMIRYLYGQGAEPVFDDKLEVTINTAPGPMMAIHVPLVQDALDVEQAVRKGRAPLKEFENVFKGYEARGEDYRGKLKNATFDTNNGATVQDTRDLVLFYTHCKEKVKNLPISLKANRQTAFMALGGPTGACVIKGEAKGYANLCAEFLMNRIPDLVSKALKIPLNDPEKKYTLEEAKSIFKSLQSHNNRYKQIFQEARFETLPYGCTTNMRNARRVEDLGYNVGRENQVEFATNVASVLELVCTTAMLARQRLHGYASYCNGLPDGQVGGRGGRAGDSSSDDEGMSGDLLGGDRTLRAPKLPSTAPTIGSYRATVLGKLNEGTGPTGPSIQSAIKGANAKLEDVWRALKAMPEQTRDQNENSNLDGILREFETNLDKFPIEGQDQIQDGAEKVEEAKAQLVGLVQEQLNKMKWGATASSTAAKRQRGED